MRTKNFALTEGYGFCGSVYYPDEICFAYNPNTLMISFTNTDEIFNIYLDKVTVFVGTFRIDCALYGDKATIKLSNIFKVFSSHFVQSFHELQDTNLNFYNSFIINCFIAHSLFDNAKIHILFESKKKILSRCMNRQG